MPFTIAHPAAVLPFGKSKYLSVTALIAGSVVPDFEFFLQLREVENIGHHSMGIVLFDLPVAMVFCFLFHGLVKNTLMANLPPYLRNRFMQYTDVNWTRFAKENKWKLLFSVILGVLTHILWDGFTHHDGLFVEMMPLLQTTIQILTFSIPVYFLLQVIFSIGGMFIMIVAIHQLPVQSSPTVVPSRVNYFWPVFFALLLLIVTIRLTAWPQYNSFWSVVMALLGGATYALLLTTVLFNKLIPLK